MSHSVLTRRVLFLQRPIGVESVSLSRPLRRLPWPCYVINGEKISSGREGERKEERVSATVSVCVCVRERERERESPRSSKRVFTTTTSSTEIAGFQLRWFRSFPGAEDLLPQISRISLELSLFLVGNGSSSLVLFVQEASVKKLFIALLCIHKRSQ